MQQPEQQRQPRRDSSNMGGIRWYGWIGRVGCTSWHDWFWRWRGRGRGPYRDRRSQVQAIRRMVAENPILTAPLIESLRQRTQ